MSVPPKKRTEILIETHRVTRVRTRRAAAVFCQICQQEVSVFSAPQIIPLLQTNLLETKRLFQSGEIHFVGDTEMICGNSLAAYLNEK